MRSMNIKNLDYNQFIPEEEGLVFDDNTVKHLNH